MTSLRSYLKQLSAQTAMEYLLLFTVVATVVLISFKSFFPGMQNTSGGYYNSVTRVIMGENPEPIHGQWCDWVPRECPTDICGPSYQRRECACPYPQFGGNLCAPQGGVGAMRSCEQPRSCPVNGGWSDWSECRSEIPCWDYSRPEEPPLGFRTRTCDDPAPANEGLPCPGPDTQACAIPACPQTPDPCRWGDYSACQSDCQQHRLCECDPSHLLGPDGLEGTADDRAPTCIGDPPTRICPNCSMWPCEGEQAGASVACSGNEEFQVPQGLSWVHYDEDTCTARKCEAICQGDYVASSDGATCTLCGNHKCDDPEGETCESCPNDCGPCECAEESDLIPVAMACSGTDMYLTGFTSTYQKFCEDRGYDAYAGCIGQDFPYEVSSAEFNGSEWVVRNHNDENNWLVTHISCFRNLCEGQVIDWGEKRDELRGGGCSGGTYSPADSDHNGGVCSQLPTCRDGYRNQGETDVDCGGPCEPCASCSDGIPNQGETGVDCGGPCVACATCSDRTINQGETGVDCGGPCPECYECPVIGSQPEPWPQCGSTCYADNAHFESGWAAPRCYNNQSCARLLFDERIECQEPQNDGLCVSDPQCNCGDGICSDGEWTVEGFYNSYGCPADCAQPTVCVNAAPGSLACPANGINSFNGEVSSVLLNSSAECAAWDDMDPSSACQFYCRNGYVKSGNTCISMPDCGDGYCAPENGENHTICAVDCSTMCGAEWVPTACGNVLVQGAYEGEGTGAACPSGCTGAGISGMCTRSGMQWEIDCQAPCVEGPMSTTRACGDVNLPAGDPGEELTLACPGGCTGSVGFQCLNGWRRTVNTCAPASQPDQYIPIESAQRDNDTFCGTMMWREVFGSEEKEWISGGPGCRAANYATCGGHSMVYKCEPGQDSSCLLAREGRRTRFEQVCEWDWREQRNICNWESVNYCYVETAEVQCHSLEFSRWDNCDGDTGSRYTCRDGDNFICEDLDYGWSACGVTEEAWQVTCNP